MNWLNLQVSVVRSPEYVGCEPVQRATWFNVLAYSAERENGGRIEGAKTWKDRQWQQTCGVTLAEVEAAGPLLTWEGTDLIVWAYPTDKQAEIQAKRKAGQRSGRKRHAKPQAPPKPAPNPPNSSASSSANGSASTEGEGKGIGKEVERELEGNGNNPPNPQGAAASPPLRGGIPETEEARRVGRLFNRRDGTAWAPKEVKEYKNLVKAGEITDENLTLLEGYYAAERSKEKGIHRRNLATFLNNFRGELDRARGVNGGAPSVDYSSPQF
jgi:hypothetical protein